MALVSDTHDPSGLGMFSKAGRFTSEKYIIFQKKDEILHNKRKFKKVSSLPTIDMKLKPEESEKKETMPEDIEKKKIPEPPKNPRKKKNEVQPFNKMLSRQQVDEIKSNRTKPPPTGYYHPKYTEIDKKVHQIWDIMRIYDSRTSSRASARDEPDLDEELSKPIAERVHMHVHGLIDMKKQTNRIGGLQSKNNPHEKRFVPFTVTEAWSKIKKIPVFDISSKKGREDNKMYINKEFAPDYQPNFDYGKPIISTSIIKFEKLMQRKPFHKMSQTNNENFFNYDHYYNTPKSQLFRRIKTPDFKRMSSREKGSENHFPFFMQKSVNSRMKLQQLNEKMLELNHFSDGRFQSTYSSFGTREKQKKEDELEDSLLID